MKQLVNAVAVGFLGVGLFGVTGCGPSHATSGGGGGGGGGEETGPGPGPDPTPIATCAANCTTDLVAARAALTAGNYQQAFDLYHCANNPEAAFGAGLTRTLLAFAGNNADALLADFGQPPLPATDVFGANGILNREAARWNGEGSLTVTGDLSVALPLERAEQQISSDGVSGLGLFQAESGADPAHGNIDISFNGTGSPITSGTTLAVTTVCAGTYPVSTIDPRLEYLDLWFDIGDASYSCSVPYSLPIAQCQPDGGSLAVTAAATAVGQPASYELRNLLLECYNQNVDLGASLYVRVNGTASATAVSDVLDTTGLHPLFGANFELASQIPVGKTVTDVMQHAGAAGSELEDAACFFKLASQGQGHVFDVPGVLFGGSDVPVSKGDTEVIASFALLGAAMGHGAWVNEISMPLGDLVCSDTQGQPPCPTGQAFVTEFNAAFASKFHPGRMAVVQRLVAEALPLLDRGISDLDGTSLLIRDAKSTAGLDALRTLVEGVNQSLVSGETPLPHVTPALLIDFQEFFASPRNPKSAGPVLRYQETCDVDVCSASTELNTTFLQRYFAGRVDADWENGDYQWADDQLVSDAFQEIGGNAQRYAVFGN